MAQFKTPRRKVDRGPSQRVRDPIKRQMNVRAGKTGLAVKASRQSDGLLGQRDKPPIVGASATQFEAEPVKHQNFSGTQRKPSSGAKSS